MLYGFEIGDYLWLGMDFENVCVVMALLEFWKLYLNVHDVHVMFTIFCDFLVFDSKREEREKIWVFVKGLVRLCHEQ